MMVTSPYSWHDGYQSIFVTSPFFVHIHDMMLLSKKHPVILPEFCEGKFAVRKTSNKFLAMAIDQCHEQNNALVKEPGEAVWLMSNPGALRRWMLWNRGSMTVIN